jgi:hypothetical protein
MIEEHERFAAERRDNRIHPPVVVQIAKRCATARDRSFRPGIGALESSFVV